MTDLKICIATGRYPRSGETFVNRHIAHLSGGNTTVICGRQVAQDTLGKKVFSRWRSNANLFDVALLPWYLWANHSDYSAPFVPLGRGKLALQQFLRAERVDAVLAEFGSQAVSIWPIAKELGLPVFAYFRGRDASRYLHVPARVEGYRRMMPNLAGVFAVSQFLLDNLAKQGLRHPNAHVVPSGTDIDAFSPSQKSPRKLLFLGRFVEKKGPELVLNAFLDLAPRYLDAELVMIGDGPLLARCKRSAASSPHGGRVQFFGHLPQDQVQRHLSSAAIFALHALTARDGETEGLPSAVQEAMAAGAAVLSTRHAGIPELVIDGQTGRLCEEHDRVGFTAAMDEMLSDPAAVAAMGRAARDLACARLDYKKLYAKVDAVIGAAVLSKRKLADAL